MAGYKPAPRFVITTSMQTPSSARLIDALDPFRLRRWLILPHVRAVLAWTVAVLAAVIALDCAWHGAICLGQNPLVSLALLTLGWLLIARDRPWLGGVVWGLLAFKPVWAAAFFLVPLLSRQRRVCAAMLLTGLVLIAATLPFVG